MMRHTTTKFTDINISGFTENHPSSITIYDTNGCILAHELSLMAIIKKFDPPGVLVIGNEAALVPERLQNLRNISDENKLDAKDVIIGSPLRNGIIVDTIMSQHIFRYLLRSVNAIRLFGLVKPNIAVCTLNQMTSAESEILVATLVNAGCKSVVVFQKSFENARDDILKKYKFILEIL